MKYRLTFHIKLVSFKNIDIFQIHGPKSIILFGAYAPSWVYSILLITQPFLSNFDKILYMCSGDGFGHVKVIWKNLANNW